MRNQTFLTGSAFHQWYADAANGKAPALRFIQRRFLRSWAHELEAYFIPAIGRLLSVTFTRYRDTWWEPAFHIKASNSLDEYRQRQAPPHTYYLDRVVYSYRRRVFLLQKIPAAQALWNAVERRGLLQRSLGWTGQEGLAIDLELSPQDTATLCLACETREFVFPNSQRNRGSRSGPTNRALTKI